MALTCRSIEVHSTQDVEEMSLHMPWSVAYSSFQYSVSKSNLLSGLTVERHDYKCIFYISLVKFRPYMKTSI